MSQTSTSGFDWRAVLASGSLGLVFAALTITGTLPGSSSTQWVAAGLVVVIGAAIGLRIPDRPLLHGLAAGFLAGLVAVETQAMFLGTYFTNNPQYADLEMPFGWSPRLATAVLGPLNAVLAGALVAALAWLVWRSTGRSGRGSQGHTR